MSEQPLPTVPRYFRCDYSNGDTVYDICWFDGLTGKVVLRYDGADPANTDERYGATPDSVIFERKGLNIKERVAVRSFTYEMAQAYHRRTIY